MISLVIPVYRNEKNLPALLEALGALNARFEGDFEVVFVVDGSPDASLLHLDRALREGPFRSQLLSLSRNFGSFSAICAGMEAAEGDIVAVMAADLQEPPELVVEFRDLLSTGEHDIAIGQRVTRDDPVSTRFAANLFWNLYRRFVQPDLPPGGVDVFACTRAVRDQLMRLGESNTSLVGLLFWVGYRRVFVPYERRAREAGVSAWTLGKKVRYLSDSIFSFSDLPIRLLLYVGILGLATSLLLTCVVVTFKLTGAIPVPGYAATVLVVTFFGALSCFGIGLIGGYVWRTFENTKQRPNFIVSHHAAFEPNTAHGTNDDER